MRAFLFLFFLSFLSHGALLAQYENPNFGSVHPQNEISRIDITMNSDSLEMMLTNLYNDHKYPAEMIFSNSMIKDTLDNIGIRIRGNTSQSSDKKSFKLSFNAFLKGEKFEGYEHFNLNGEHNDPSVMRSKLSWDILWDADYPGSRTSYVEFYINGDYRGVYINVEHIDEQFVQARFGENDGNLYKCTYPADLHYKGIDPDAYKEEFWGKRAYELKTNTDDDDYADLAEFIDVLNNTSSSNFACELEEVFNVNHYLRAMAIDVLIGNWDGPLFNKNNFYLYKNQCTGQFEYIPYDLDNTYGIDWFNIDWSMRNLYTWGNTNEYRPLFDKIIQHEVYRKQFTEMIDQLLNTIFSETHLFPKLDLYYDLIYDKLSLDPFYPLDYGFDMDDFETCMNTGLGGHVPLGLKEYISSRISSAEDQLESTFSKPAVYYSTNSFPDENGEKILFETKVWEVGVSEVKLFLRQSGESWKEHDMKDDGANGDLIMDDGIYSYAYSSWNYDSDLEYYIQIFSTSGQWNQYPGCSNQIIPLSIEIPNLHLNEWMASNSNTISDESGEFPDWIEIYNGGTSAIAMGKYYLTDDAFNRTKWNLPDASINPGQFLLFWADKDEEQGPFHTNFKLSSGGEHIGIYDSKSFGHRKIDAVDYGEQTTDVSQGLLTDGGEEIVFFNEPTPKASNEATSISDIQNSTFKMHPNPATEHVQFSHDGLMHAELSIYNSTGKLMYQKEIINNFSSINIRSWNPGLYLVVVSSDGGFSIVDKLVVSN